MLAALLFQPTFRLILLQGRFISRLTTVTLMVLLPAFQTWACVAGVPIKVIAAINTLTKLHTTGSSINFM